MSSTDGCDHVGYAELVTMAEEQLRAARVPEPEWEGRRFTWGENVHTPYWVSIFLEVERRDGSWVMTRMDRNQEPVTEEDLGLQER